MDIRVSAYRPGVTVQTFSTPRGAATSVTNAEARGPVPPVAPVTTYSRSTPQDPLQEASTDGYTDSVRGTRINILA